MRAPKSIQGATIGQSQIRSKYGITVLGMKRAGQPFVYTTDETRIEEDDMLILSGNTSHMEDFARRARAELYGDKLFGTLPRLTRPRDHPRPNPAHLEHIESRP